ncbi:hypothetical protein ACQP00_04765 [Dactylosporangium sp. CS-047395]|uniref:hypothetical protein n=1 Tax=Dactylosporangium sp. CS-047395 TaxID=3239936 RepID=UPI003D933047
MANSRQIKIDHEGMRDFSAQLQSLVDKDIGPTASAVRHQLTGAPPFGVHTASPAVQAAALRYWHQMEEAIEFLQVLSHNTGAIARTALDVVTTYENADINSVTQLRSIEGGASTAQTTSERITLEAERQAAEQERFAMLNERRQQHGSGA